MSAFILSFSLQLLLQLPIDIHTWRRYHHWKLNKYISFHVTYILV